MIQTNLFEEEQESPSFELWPHQIRAKGELRQAMKMGHKRVVLQIATGGGKTRLCAEIILDALKRGSKVVFAVPLKALVDQTVREFQEAGIKDIGVIQAQHAMTDWMAPVQVASIQTLIRRPLPEADLIIIDECFPAGTMISTPRGDRPIEKIVPGELVCNATGIGRVVSLYKSSHIKFVKVRLSNGRSFKCTPNHPIFTMSGWKKAGELVIREMLFGEENMPDLWRGVPSLHDPEGGTCGASRIRRELQQASMLQSILREEIEKPYAQAGNKREGFTYASGDEAYSSYSGRKRETSSSYPARDIENFRAKRVGNGVRSKNASNTETGIPSLLQGGFGASRIENSTRTRWDESLRTNASGTRPEKRRFASLPWVESIEVEEQSCAEPVYNLHVSRHPSYFANGVLVHNCHIFYRGLWKCVDSEQWKNKFVIGLSATPWAKGMGRRWGCLVICGTTAELIDSGVLCHYRIMVPPDEFKPDRSKVQVKDGEFVDDSAITALSEPKLVGNVVNTWLEYGPGCETFLYGQNCAHAKDMQKEFQNAGINCGYIDGDSEEDEILDMWKKYDSHEYPVVASVGCLVAGIDKRVQCIILDMMTKSIIKYMQIVGRSFRTNGDPDKVALILDHGGNTLVLGEPRNIQYDHLDMSKPSDKGSAYQGEKEPPKPRECKHCHHIINRAAKTCPYCHEALVPVKDSDVIHEEGELVEFGSHKKKKERVYTMEEKQDWYSGLLYLCKERGKSENIASHRYRDKFKVWPNQLKKEPKPPSFEVEQFDRHCRIAWAKSQKKKEAAVA